MSIIVTVNNIPFNLPTEGEPAPWGESLTNYLAEVAAVLNSLKGANDILETGANIALNQTTFADIQDFKFNPNTVRSFIVNGSISRTTDSVKQYEQFTLTGLRTDTDWILFQEGLGDTGVILDITNAGQVQYKSSTISGSNYAGKILFRGIAVAQS
jgi:hypothetical protein